MTTSGERWTPPSEIVLLDDEALCLVDELIRSLAKEQTGASFDTPELNVYDPYRETNLGWLKAAYEQQATER